jgi:hypothetical protein
MTSKVYDALKQVAQIWLPALGAAYFSLAGIWGFPNPEDVVGTIVVIDTFLGVVLHISTQTYSQSEKAFDGTAHIMTSPDGTEKTFMLVLNKDPAGELVDIESKPSISFKISKETPKVNLAG